ncbi:MAG TPA: type II CAAX endopeptidase family protein [Terriglobia bacterium]|jgi:membrane protease YdiL (CAAX protease family)|nr:type II CAAX endopeptidase family protein [Terriglobia bacterium]
MLATSLRLVFSLFLMAGVPLLSWRTARPEQVQGIPKTALYFSAIVSQWVLAGTGVLVAFVAWPDWGAVGIAPARWATLWEWVVMLVAVSVAGLLGILVLERRGWWPKEPEMVRMLMPENHREKLWAVLGLAPTAGLCEEFLYRGFLLAEASAWAHSAGWGIVISSVAFGLAHSYQGANGMARAGLLGALLAWPVVRLGSLYPSMVAHFLIDAVALLWLGPKFVRERS